MLEQCFVAVSPLIMILIALLITSVAIVRVFNVFKGEKMAFAVITSFLVMTAISFIFMACWAFVVSLLELAVAFYMSNKKLVVLRH